MVIQRKWKQSSELRIHRIVILYITKQYIREGWCGYLDRSVIPYITKQYIHAGWWRDFWKCGPREAVTKGSGDEEKWWWMEVMTIMAARLLHGTCVGEEAGERNLVSFRVGGCSWRWKVPRVCGGCGLGSAKSWSSPQCNGCFDVFRVFLHIAVTWCFGSCGCETHCNGCMSVARCFFCGGRHETVRFLV